MQNLSFKNSSAWQLVKLLKGKKTIIPSFDRLTDPVFSNGERAEAFVFNLKKKFSPNIINTGRDHRIDTEILNRLSTPPFPPPESLTPVSPILFQEIVVA